MIKVIGLVYSKPHHIGDFGWMLKQPLYNKAFFIFNDNQTQFLQHQNDPTSSGGCSAGGGNAVIRPYQCSKPPRAGGIPTGDYGIPGGPGYPKLTQAVKGYVNQAILAIRNEVITNGYDTVFYSGDGHGGLGTGIFSPSESVKAYIVKQINSLHTYS